MLQSRTVDQHVGGTGHRVSIKVRGSKINLEGTAADLAGDPGCRSQVDVGDQYVGSGLG
jgi:hypothetical protein